jgi:hypothetical protein
MVLMMAQMVGFVVVLPKAVASIKAGEPMTEAPVLLYTALLPALCARAWFGSTDIAAKAANTMAAIIQEVLNFLVVLITLSPH